ncbi:MAG TPA: SH3 domain-containing protein [Candidatus Limnocylindrales bacterium]|jgi:hypothetical protein
MRGIARVATRLVVMALVMVGVVVTASAVGLPTAAVLGMSITLAGLVGMLRLSRRPAATTDADAAVAAMRVGDPVAATPTDDPNASSDPVVAAMAPDQVVDPEALMPRWRRPSLLAARKADPSRLARVERIAQRFPAGTDSTSRRVIRYAMVALLDRPDEVMGLQLADLASGDEVEVLEASGPFWQVVCPDGMTGWVHRTTLGAISPESQLIGRRIESEPDDLLTAVLSARGIH